MALVKIKVGDIITISNEKNVEDKEYPFYGININKEFMLSVANTDNVDRKKYKIMRKNRFVFSGMQTGRDECIRIGMFDKDEPVLVSPAYTTFEVTNDKVLPTYLFMKFKSKEMDRYGSFLSDSSVRANLDWDRFCDIELEIPSIEIQKKYVAIYEGLLANLRSYEKGLDDLKLVCDGYIEDLRKKCPSQPLGNYIEIVNETNENSLISNVQGVSAESKFIDTKANLTEVKLLNYTIVAKNMFAYNPSRINIGSIALYKKDEPCIVSPMYVVFRLSNNANILPEYLMLWLSRREFLRSTLFYASGSVRDVFSFELMKEVKIPIPDLSIQKDIVNVFDCLSFRKNKLKMISTQIENICPILIRGSISEAKGLNNYE